MCQSGKCWCVDKTQSALLRPEQSVRLVAAGAQCNRAAELYEQMQQQGCTPDVVTFTALISAYEKGGQWRRALAAYEMMRQQHCKPDAIVYNAIIDALWETGVVWAQRKALVLYQVGVSLPFVCLCSRTAANRKQWCCTVCCYCVQCHHRCPVGDWGCLGTAHNTWAVPGGWVLPCCAWWVGGWVAVPGGLSHALCVILHAVASFP